ncbi:hypothetical protein CLTEP_16700 [Clostridium tepidiprofundi DSM 19306]|uniref:Bacterial SH3 domain protein n=1 Tax=Clostridium tepidiprofundi DSM 19306 TaxID=1121338 RepID=A0A151B3W6_9CLOT|nr:SH3 domain-containing protein [Clostridium tepidiprofundi]KYH34347.1 hypothetical protein CLTEP_16700 [Clostridium tepidiprofundi DSM 19306]
MILLLFLLMLILIAILYFKYNSIIASQKRQIILLSKKNTELRNKINRRNSSLKDIMIKFTLPQCSDAVTNTACNLYVAPINNSLVINSLEKDIKLKVLDCAEVTDDIWFRVAFNCDDDLNNKGWIKEEYITKISI